jgi:hypothetical protein
LFILTRNYKFKAGEIRKNRKKGGPTAGGVEDSTLSETGRESSMVMKGPKTTKSSIKSNDSQ